MTYAYVALEPSGKKRTGFVDASDQDAAIALVAKDGRYVVEIKEERRANAPTAGQPGVRRRVNRSDLALFTRRLADLSAAGLPLDRVLQVISEQSESAALAHVAEEALTDVRGGLPVSDALAKHPKLFPPIYTMTLKAGEASGQFPQVAERLADFQEVEVTRRSTIISALIYPAILAITAVGVIVMLMTYVVPKLSDVFKAMGNDLPVNTRILMDSANFLSDHWVTILLLIFGCVMFYRGSVKTESGAYARDNMLLKAPLIGPVVKKATISRYARVLGTLVFGGVPILEALSLSGMAAGNRVFLVQSNEVANDVREGKPIAAAMRDANGFPPVLTNMVAVGEETGDLPKMLGRVSDSLDFEVDHAMRRLTSLVEPIIVLVMGTFVGFVVLSVLLPIVQAQSLIK
ncbi:MAG TPA: type II secretion system F family protein [Fimbriimonadaceae bacterium]|nr:type II secretion system F family protein [Fimbriimonadaceae bacterium]